MMENLVFSLNAVLPLILIIFLGFFLKKVKLFNDNFVEIGNKSCYYFFIPLLLFYNIYNIENFKNIDFKVILYAVLLIILLFLIGIVVVKLFIKDDKQKGVILQCTFHSNYAIVGVPLAFALGGSQAVAIVSILSFFCIPLFSILAVISFSMFEKQSSNKMNIKQTLIRIIKNPIIIGVSLGFIIIIFRYLLSLIHLNFSIKDNLSFLYLTVKDVSKISSPLALLFLGAQFNFSGFKPLKKEIIFGTTIRLVIIPIIALFGAYMFKFEGIVFPALIGIFATPLAVTSSSMAVEMNQDSNLANNIIVWSSIFSVISLFLIILVCKINGFF